VIRHLLVLVVIVLGACCLHGCSGATVTSDQQKAKAKALQDVADEHPDPNREQRPG